MIACANEISITGKATSREPSKSDTRAHCVCAVCARHIKKTIHTHYDSDSVREKFDSANHALDHECYLIVVAEVVPEVPAMRPVGELIADHCSAILNPVVLTVIADEICSTLQ